MSIGDRFWMFCRSLETGKLMHSFLVVLLGDSFPCGLQGDSDDLSSNAYACWVK
jgi:hypothetical protein